MTISGKLDYYINYLKIQEPVTIEILPIYFRLKGGISQVI